MDSMLLQLTLKILQHASASGDSKQGSSSSVD